MKIEYSKKAVKYIDTLDTPIKQRLKSGIEGLTKNPPMGNIKLMQSYADGTMRLMRLRVGSLRIVYRYSEDEENKAKKLCIIDIDSRRDIYKYIPY